LRISEKDEGKGGEGREDALVINVVDEGKGGGGRLKANVKIIDLACQMR